MAPPKRPQLEETPFRQFLPDLSLPRFTTMQEQDAREYAKAFKESGQPPWLHALYMHWQDLFKEPYQGITNDGTFHSPIEADSRPVTYMMLI